MALHHPFTPMDGDLKTRSVTDFQRRVYEQTSLIPRGKVVSYGELARSLNCHSAQAVGQALRRNPFAPNIPCHRVVGSNGELGGFFGKRGADAAETKRNLLISEGVTFETPSQVSARSFHQFDEQD